MRKGSGNGLRGQGAHHLAVKDQGQLRSSLGLGLGGEGRPVVRGGVVDCLPEQRNPKRKSKGRERLEEAPCPDPSLNSS